MKSPFASSSVFYRKQARIAPPKLKGYRGLNIEDEFLDSFLNEDDTDDDDLEFYIADDTEQYRLNAMPGVNWEYRL